MVTSTPMIHRLSRSSCYGNSDGNDHGEGIDARYSSHLGKGSNNDSDGDKNRKRPSVILLDERPCRCYSMKARTRRSIHVVQHSIFSYRKTIGVLLMIVCTAWRLSGVVIDQSSDNNNNNNNNNTSSTAGSRIATTNTTVRFHDHAVRDHYWRPVRNRDWCRRSTTSSAGLVYIKVDKAASSTLAGINIQIARDVGSKVLKGGSSPLWPWSWPWSTRTGRDAGAVCSHTFRHERASKALADQARMYRSQGQTRRQSSVLSPKPQSTADQFLAWTFVREPFQRTLSEYHHFYVSRFENTATQSSFNTYLKQKKNFELLYILDVEDPTQEVWNILGRGPAYDSSSAVNSNGDHHAWTTETQETSDDTMKKLIQDHILDSYDFIGVVERMEESLAVMKILWDLPLRDLIVLPAKKSGAYDDGRYNGTCHLIQPPSSTLSSSASTFQSGTLTNFSDGNYDYLLYDMINTSLDNTIKVLGQDLVEKTLAQLSYWQQKAEDKCQQKAIFPCSKDGIRQHDLSSKDCLWFDSGCGYKCVDKVMSMKG